jgi:hypothetical protein
LEWLAPLHREPSWQRLRISDPNSEARVSYQATHYVAKSRGKTKTPAEKLVWFVIADNTDQRTRMSAQPMSFEEIAADAETSTRTVIRATKLLVDAGELKWIKKAKSSGQKNTWHLLGDFACETVTSTAATGDNVSSTGDSLSSTGDNLSPAIRKEERQEEKQDHHSFAGLIAAWTSIKEQLKTRLPAEEWNFWVRPMFVLRVRPSEGFILFALPPNNRMAEAAKANRVMLIELLIPHGYKACSFQFYPDDYELGRMQRDFPEIYEQLPEALKKRRPEKVTA